MRNSKFMRRLLPDKYMIRVRNVDGSERIRITVTAKTPQLAHEMFMAFGFKYYKGAGYFDRDGTIADAYLNKKFINYPTWIEGEDDE